MTQEDQVYPAMTQEDQVYPAMTHKDEVYTEDAAEGSTEKSALLPGDGLAVDSRGTVMMTTVIMAMGA